MSNIHKWPRQTNETVTKTTALVELAASIQFAVALLWPVLKWILSIDVTWQFIRVLYFWNTPGMHAGFTFLLHFSAFSGLIYFVGMYRPPGDVGPGKI